MQSKRLPVLRLPAIDRVAMLPCSLCPITCHLPPSWLRTLLHIPSLHALRCTLHAARPTPIHHGHTRHAARPGLHAARPALAWAHCEPYALRPALHAARPGLHALRCLRCLALPALLCAEAVCCSIAVGLGVGLLSPWTGASPALWPLRVHRARQGPVTSLAGNDPAQSALACSGNPSGL